MSAKRGETYSSVVSFLRRRFRFDLLKRGGPTPFLYMATRFLPNVHVQKCTKMYIYVFSCLEVPWIDLLAVANLQ